MKQWVFFAIIAGIVSSSASAQQPKYASEEAAKYAEAALTLISEGLLQLWPGLSSATDQMDTIYVSYPYISLPNREPDSPPQGFLDRLSCYQIVFAPWSQKPAEKWDNYLVIDIFSKNTEDSVNMSIE